MWRYKEYEFLELFEREPEIIGEKGNEIYIYKRLDDYGFTLEMNLSLQEKFCRLALFYKDLKEPQFDFGFENVESIECREDRLIIQQTGNPERIVMFFKPNYALLFEDRPS